jgi:hypothetical protein
MSMMAVMGFPAAGQRSARFYRIDNTLVMSGKSEAFQSVAEPEDRSSETLPCSFSSSQADRFTRDQDDGEETGQSTSAPR